MDPAVPARVRVRGYHPLWLAFPKPFCYPCQSRLRSEPQHARTLVWAPPVSLAATPGIDVSFSSSGYLDVSVHRVPLHALWIYAWILEVCSRGFPHSDIRGSLDMCSSPRLFAACHVFHRLLVPRHPPCALICFTSTKYFSYSALPSFPHSVTGLSENICYSLCQLRRVFRLMRHRL